MLVQCLCSTNKIQNSSELAVLNIEGVAVRCWCSACVVPTSNDKACSSLKSLELTILKSGVVVVLVATLKNLNYSGCVGAMNNTGALLAVKTVRPVLWPM